jgi:CRP-like cAMP-binding protein
MADFLDEKRREIASRLKELRPLVDEYHRLEAASAALEGVTPGSAAPARSAARGRKRAGTAAKPRRAGTGRRGRPKGSGTRGKEALKLITSKPGITIPELAKAMGIQQNYLYRVVPDLQKQGLVRKDGRGWHPMK